MHAGKSCGWASSSSASNGLLRFSECLQSLLPRIAQHVAYKPETDWADGGEKKKNIKTLKNDGDMHSRCARYSISIPAVFGAVRTKGEGGRELITYIMSLGLHISGGVSQDEVLGASLPSPIHHTFHAESKLDAVYIGSWLLPVRAPIGSSKLFCPPRVTFDAREREERLSAIANGGTHTHTPGGIIALAGCPSDWAHGQRRL